MPSRQFETIPPDKAEAQPTHEMDGSETTELQQAGGGQPARVGSALLQLQRTRGNRHVQGVVDEARQVADPAPIIQTKLVLGMANDQYEREADRVAEQVGRGATTSEIQHMHGAEGDSTDAIDAGVQQAIQSAHGGGRPLPESVRAPMEQALGADFGGVRVHTGAQADLLNQSLQAQAFTTGRDIFFRRGDYDPDSRSGRELLTHELTHVVQQGAGDGGADGHAAASSAPTVIQRKVITTKDARKIDLDVVSFDYLRGLLANDLIKSADLNDVNGRMQELHLDFVAAGFAMNDLLTALGISTDSKSKITPEGRFSPAKMDKIRDNIEARLKNGTPLSKNALAAIKKLSQLAEGKVLLERAGLDTYDNAKAYLQASDYKNWLQIGVKKRVLYATIAWREGIGKKMKSPPPAYTLGRHMAIKGGKLTQAAQTKYEQERDTHIREAFVNTLTHTKLSKTAKNNIQQGRYVGETPNVKQVEQQTSQAGDILTKIFLILQAGLQVYDPNQNQHVDYQQGDVARALAHGGRVNIRIPALKHGETAYDLTNWIGITTGQGKQTSDAVFKRGFGTHHMDIGKNTYDPQGDLIQRGRFVEEGGKGAAKSNRTNRKGVKLWGMNVAAGGLGKLDFNGDVILPDGAHGHMFIGLTKPTATKDGALQIGLETTGPGASSLVGYVHNWNSTEATANPESSFYGHKSAKIGKGGLGYNERYVDLAALATQNQTWQQNLGDLEGIWNQYLQNEADKTKAYRTLVGPRG